MMFSQVALAQINPIVGDLSGNCAKIEQAAREAASLGAKIVVFPELCVTGYPIEDLALQPAFQTRAMQAVEQLATRLKDAGICIILGTIWRERESLYNAALLLEHGNIVHIQPKVELPNYGVFDEKRVFNAGALPSPINIQGIPTGILICEDIWQPRCARHLQQAGAKRLIVLNGSPFEEGKLEEQRYQLIQNTAKLTGLSILYVNLVGGQDDILFDGGSFIYNADGAITAQFPRFVEGVWLADNPPFAEAEVREDVLWQALTLGLRDYVNKNGFPGVLLGLSGGIDSAVVAALAVDALGPDRVFGVLLPSPYTSEESNTDAYETARLLGIKTYTLPITPAMQSFESELSPVFADISNALGNWQENPSIGGNLQARIRGAMLMGLSNATGFMLLNTSNKSEIAVGYSTLYGDSCGGYAPIRDIYKMDVYKLAEWRNTQSKVIPENSITRAPSAELKPDQKDSDQLPPYTILDAILHALIEKRMAAEEINLPGIDASVIKRVAHLLRISEYKRRQSAPGTKVTSMVFGRDRRIPLTNQFVS